MRKLALIISILLVLSAGYILVSAVQTPYEQKFDITSEKHLILDFSSSTVSVEGWDQNYVSIKQKEKLIVNKKDMSNLLDRNFSVIKKGSAIVLQDYTPFSILTYRLQTWFPLIQFEKYRKNFRGSTPDDERDLSAGLSIGTINSRDLASFEIKVPKELPVQIIARTYSATNYTKYYGDPAEAK